MKRVHRPDVRDGWYEITPSNAQQQLDNGSRNRPLSEFRAQKLAAEIQAGRFRENGESVIFDPQGRLLDGQHRLRACVLANKPITTYCVFGIPNSYFASLDQGKIRGGGDLAALMDFSNYNTVAALARIAIRYADGTFGKTGRESVVSAETLAIYMKHNRTNLESAVGAVAKYTAGIRKITPLPHPAFVYYANLPDEDGRAMEFVESIATGAGLGKNDVRLMFRQRMLDLVGQKHTLTQEHKLALLIKTWNAYRAGTKVGVLRWRPVDEPFPRLVASVGSE